MTELYQYNKKYVIDRLDKISVRNSQKIIFVDCNDLISLINEDENKEKLLELFDKNDIFLFSKTQGDAVYHSFIGYKYNNELFFLIQLLSII